MRRNVIGKLRYRVSMLNPLHCPSCSSQDRITEVGVGIGLSPGSAWACTEALSQKRLPWEDIVEFQTLALLPNSSPQGLCFYSENMARPGSGVQPTPMFPLVPSEAGLGVGHSILNSTCARHTFFGVFW